MTDKERIEELRKNKFKTIQFLESLPKEHVIDLLLEYKAERDFLDSIQNQKAIDELKTVKNFVDGRTYLAHYINQRIEELGEKNE